MDTLHFKSLNARIGRYATQRQTLVALVSLTVFAAAHAQQAVTSYTITGNNVFPESIAYDAVTGDFYVSNTEDGTIYQGNARNGPAELSVFLHARTDGRNVVMGLALDERGRLFMAGGASGRAYIYNTENGTLVEVLETPPTARTLLNDVIVTEQAAYLTDSFRPTLFRIPLDTESLEIEPWLDLTATPVRYGEGNNLDGIVADESGRYLVTIQPNTGLLYRIDTETKEVSGIDLEGNLGTGNGLFLDAQTLYVVNDEGGEIIPVNLSVDFTRGVIGTSFTDASLKFPTALAKAGERLLVVNHQQAPITLPFTVSSLPLP